MALKKESTKMEEKSKRSASYSLRRTKKVKYMKRKGVTNEIEPVSETVTFQQNWANELEELRKLPKKTMVPCAEDSGTCQEHNVEKTVQDKKEATRTVKRLNPVRQKYRSLKKILLALDAQKSSAGVENLVEPLRENPSAFQTLSGGDITETERNQTLPPLRAAIEFPTDQSLIGADITKGEKEQTLSRLGTSNDQALFGEDITEIERDETLALVGTPVFQVTEIEKDHSLPLEGSPIEVERDQILPLLGTPFFQVCITEHNIPPFYQLDVPSKMNRFLPHDNVHGALICGGKRWDIVYLGSMKMRERIIAGWKIFVLENNLKVGDVCLFELMMDESSNQCVVFRVQILKEAIPMAA